jgi:hypothetical protein
MLSVDETPPTDSSSSGSPAAPSPVPPQKSFSKRAAKLTLWSPFAGLLILIVFMAAIGERNGGPHLVIASSVMAVCWLIWVAGLVLGIMALRRRKTEGRKGVSGRAFTGMTLNLLFLGVTIWGVVMVVGMEAEITKMRDKTAETEAEKVRAKVGDGEALQKELAAYADRAFAANVLELQKKYQTSAAALTNPPVLDMTLVQSKEDLRAREEAVGDFITASKDLRDFCDSAPDFYRRELLKHKLTPEAREASLKKFDQSLRGMNPAIVALREADVRRGQAMLKLVTFLEANWGKWEYSPETDRLRFQGSKLSEDYHRANQELKDLSTETMRLQAELKKLSNTNTRPN